MPRLKLITVTIAGSNWPPDVASGVFVQWCIHLGTSQLGLTQWSGPSKPAGAVTISNPSAGLSFTITPSGRLSWKVTEIDGISSDEIYQIVSTASAKTRATDSGRDLVYQVKMESKSPPIGEELFLHMFRMLGDQIPIAGPRRLCDVALLDFAQDLQSESGQPLFVPDTEITVSLFAPGPTAGPLTQGAVGSTFETIAAICSIAIGRPVTYDTAAHFPVTPELAEPQHARRSDPGIGGLARNYISLDIFGELANLGGPDSVIRARNSLITMHEAQRQANSDIAVMLYICAIEALITPGRRCGWRKNQVTKRFREAVLLLCKDDVDRLLAHANLEEALAFSRRGSVDRQRRSLLDHIYDLRSLPTHTGVGPRNISVHTFNSKNDIKVALLSDLSRSALLAYVRSPMSFLTGHPASQDQ